MLPLPRGAVWQLLFLFCAALYINGVRSEGRVVCYYTNWSVYRPGTAKFNPQNINPYLCTHLIYAFGGFTKDNQMKPFDKYQDIEQGGYAKFTGLKTYNKQLKTMIAIGGWNEASSRFSPLVANPERRQKFIKNMLKFLRQNHFDGIDLDWEYPAHREGGKARDRDNYAQFVQELRAEFEREAEKTGRPRLLVTMAVPAGIEYIEKGYDIPKLNKYLDWFNVLTYDFHSSHEPSVNHHAPLYSLEEESEYNFDAELNIDYSIKFYLNAGADKDKLVLGIPTYGRSFTLINEESTEIGAPAEAPGEQGDATREKGYLAYYEICQNLKEDPEWTVVQPNSNAMGPYAYRRNQWVGYDDEAIVRKKAQYVVDNGLGGIMFWAIDNDDFRGTCSGKPYPLIEAAKDAMLDALGLGINEVSKPSAPQKPSRSRSRENSSSTRNRITIGEQKLTYAERKASSKRTQTTQQSTRNRQQSTTNAPSTIKLTEAEGSSLYIGGRTTTPPPPTTPDPGTDFKCEDEGFFQHPRDCKKYYWCLDSGPSGLGIVAHMFTCPSGLYFNPAADSCDFARNVPCKIKKSTTSVTSAPTTTTTTARPTSSVNRLTATPTRTSFYRTTSTTTTTTTEAPEEEEAEYEEDEDNIPSPFAKHRGLSEKEAEEDPKVIKELIELIRKVGGIEELEKHLLRKDDGTIAIKENSSSSSSSLVATTPSSISKSLYEKVLSKPNALNSFRNRFISTSSFRNTQTKTAIKAHDGTEEDEESDEIDTKSSGASAGYSKYSSVVRGNSRQGPQNEGIEKLPEFEGFRKEKKQYTTINRNRSNKKVVEEDEEEESVIAKSQVESHEDEEEDVDDKTFKRPTSNTPAYSTIKRTRPSTTTEATDKLQEQQEEKDIGERKSYSTLNKSRVRGTATTELPDVTELTAGSTRYKYLERTRPTRPTTESTNNLNDEEVDDNDEDLKDHQNTVQLKANENTRETQQQKDITTNTQRSYASIGRRTTATPETETATIPDKIVTTTTTATPTTKTPITTTPLTNLETTPESLIISTTNSNIPITTTTNPITVSTTTSTTTTTLPNGEEVLESLLTTTPNPNEINTDSESLSLSLNINSLITETKTEILLPRPNSSSTSPTTESGLDTNKQEIDSTITETTTISTVNDIVPKTEELNEEVNLVSKQRHKTLYNTRTRTTTTTPQTTTTDIATTSSPTNTKKPLAVRRQQLLLNRSSQTKTTTSPTTELPTPTTESVNNDFLGTVSSPRPFGFPKRRTRPTASASISTTTTTTEETIKPNEESLVTKQKTTKLNAAVNTQTQKKYQFQRRTTTTTATTTTEKPVEANADNNDEEKDDEVEVVTKAQVNDNEREISTNILETTAPTTESPSSPTAPLARRIKVLKLKRPLVSNSNSTTNTSVIDSSATNFNASHTETQNIVKLSSVSEVDEQLVETHTLTETETYTEIPIQTSPTPKRFRKVIRKLIRPVNRTTEIVPENNAVETTTIIEGNKDSTISSTATATVTQRVHNVTRVGFNRSSKFSLTNQKSNAEEKKEVKEQVDEDEENADVSAVSNRGRNKFTLPSAISTSTRKSLYGTTNRNRFANKPQSSTTTEGSKTSEEDSEESGEDEEKNEEEEEEEITPASESNATGNSIYTSTNRITFSRSSSTTQNPLRSQEQEEEEEEENSEDSADAQLETTTQDEIKENSSFKLFDLQKLRDKVRIDSAKQQDLGVLSDRLKTTKTVDDKEQTVDPLLKLRNKVQQDIAKGNQNEGVLSDRFKFIKTEQENDDPPLKLRKSNQGEGVESFNLKKLLDKKSNTSTLNYKLDDIENDSVTAQDSLHLQKIRNKVQTNLARGDQDQGVVSSRLKKLLSEKISNTQTDTNSVEESSIEIKQTSDDEDFIEQPKPFIPKRPIVPNSRNQLTEVENNSSSQPQEIQESSTSAPKERPTFRRKLIAKRPYTPTKPPLSALATTTVKIPSALGKKKYVKRKFGRFHPFNTSNRNTGEGFVRKDPRGNLLPGAERFKVEGSAGGLDNEGEDYEEYDEEEGDEKELEEEIVKPVQLEKPILPVRPVIARPPGLFNRPQSSILKKTPSQSTEQGSGENKNEDEEDDESEDEAIEDEEEEEEEETNTPIINRPSYKPKNNRIPAGARSTLNGNKPFTTPRLTNTPNKSAGSLPTTTPIYGGNRFGSSSRATNKPRVVNRPQGVAAPNLTLKSVAKDFERTTVLIPTKPAPFINSNTRAYERKYKGPSTEASIDQNNDKNPLIEDLNIEALNARNKKIFDIHSKKHTNPLKQKVLIPFGNLNENTQQEQLNTENENDEGYQSSVNDGYATTTTTTNTPLASTLDNTNIGTQNTTDENPSNVINLNEISSQADLTTTQPPSTTLQHIFTLADDEHTTRNPLDDANLVVMRHGEKVTPKYKVVEINRIVEVNSKEEKLKRKSKANTIRTIEGSQTYKVESLPHFEQLGEISVVKYVHKVEGSDIIIEGRSKVTDYTPTETTIGKVSEPVRNSYPEGNVERMAERYGKALIPEVIREAVETSTISLEGLFENARKGKVLNTIDDIAFTQQQPQETVTENFTGLETETSTESSTIFTVETSTESSNNKKVETSTDSFNILKSIAFDIAKINLEPNSAEIEIANKSLGSAPIATTTTESSVLTTSSVTQAESSSLPRLTTTLAPETLNVESSTVASEEMQATTVPAALFPQYVRPIVPLLRPESNESSPLVISIANLDKVILSKVKKMENGEQIEEEENKEQHQQQVNKNNTTPNPNTENPETINITTIIPNNNNNPTPKTQLETIPQFPDINDSNGAFSSRSASVVKAPLLNSLQQQEAKQLQNRLDEAEEITQTELYTINEGPRVGSTTSSTLGSKVNEVVSFSSETTVVRTRKAKSRKFKNKNRSLKATSTTAPTTVLVSES